MVVVKRKETRCPRIVPFLQLGGGLGNPGVPNPNLDACVTADKDKEADAFFLLRFRIYWQ